MLCVLAREGVAVLAGWVACGPVRRLVASVLLHAARAAAQNMSDAVRKLRVPTEGHLFIMNSLIALLR
jgi:hypothetical protein|tara:strand:- start:196 stop:399 length:204 start_codon:yes stop_codon:yes gene_type:complete